jgi:hypothetical protein
MPINVYCAALATSSYVVSSINDDFKISSKGETHHKRETLAKKFHVRGIAYNLPIIPTSVVCL